MKRIARRARILSIVIALFVLCTIIFMGDYTRNAKKWVVHPANRNLYQNGMLKSSGTVTSADGVTLLTLDEQGTHYAEDANIRKATLHAIGDPKENILTGVLKKNKTDLVGYNLINGLSGSTSKKTQLALTLDADLCTTAYKALGKLDGTVGVYNYKTGEILCMVSKPTYDPTGKAPDVNSEEYQGLYINRLTNGLYTPGSIMKLVTAVAAIETLNDLDSRTYTCQGGTTIDGEFIKCTGTHGTIGFAEGLAHSCNAVFGILGTELGTDVLQEYAEKAGIMTSFHVDGTDTSKGRFSVAGASQSELAWAAIGQHTTMVNPMQFMIFMGAIAQDGQAVSPYYVKRFTDTIKLPRTALPGGKEKRIFEEETMNRMTELMRNNTIVSYDDNSFPNMNLCAKTGTAQVDDGKSHSWFTGFLDNPDTPLAFVVIAEHGGSSSTAVSIAKTVLKEAVGKV